MGRRCNHFQDALRFLQWTWKSETGLPAGLGEYLAGIVDVTVEEADRLHLGHFQRMLAADCLRLHRASVETGPDALTRARLVGSLDRAMGRLGLERMSRRAPSWGTRAPIRPAQGMGKTDGGGEAA
jgi:hypothetical protein